MRNIFDQYRHHENRLTHALACCLSEDRALLTAFIGWAGHPILPRKDASLHVVEQRLPGQPEVAEEEEKEEAERSGLPDAWIFDQEGSWALLIESKVKSPIDPKQLRRHVRTAERRGYVDCHLVLISIKSPAHPLGEGMSHRLWTDVYQWASHFPKTSRWAGRLAEYMEAAERRMLADQYLLEGTLTTFAGIKFDTENPYGYTEAKRQLKLLMEQLKTRKQLKTQLGADIAAQGRAAITGRGRESVWDFMPLAIASDSAAFTSHPQLTLAIRRDHVTVQITIPNGLDPRLRKLLLADGFDGFKADAGAFIIGISKVLQRDIGASPFIAIVQRHYASQRSEPVRDAVLEFDPRTAVNSTTAVKYQEDWLRATHAAFSKRRSNLQIGIGVTFPYHSSTSVRTAEFVDAIELTWLACRPILHRMNLV